MDVSTYLPSSARELALLSPMESCALESVTRKNYRRKRGGRLNFRLSHSSRAYKPKVEPWRKAEIAICEGHGRMDIRPYHPFITVAFNSTGFSSRHIDPAAGDLIDTLSLGESDLTRCLLLDDGHVEFFPQVALLPREETVGIAERFKIKHPVYEGTSIPVVFTTDLVDVRWVNGKKQLFAYSVKYSPTLDQRKWDLMRIERRYWRERDVHWKVVFRSNLNPHRIENVRWVEGFLAKSPLIPGRDQWQKIEQDLYPRIVRGLPINEAAFETEAALALEDGVALSQIRFYIASKIWKVNLDSRISTFRPLTVLKRNNHLDL